MKRSAKKTMALTGVLACVMAGAMVGCEKDETAGEATQRTLDSAAKATGDAMKGAGEAIQETGEKAAEMAGDAADAVSDAARSARDSAVKMAEETLAEIKPQVDAWAQKASEATGLEKPVMENLVKGVKDGVSNVESKLGELKGAAADQWEPLSKELGSAVDSLKKAVSAAMSKFGG